MPTTTAMRRSMAVRTTAEYGKSPILKRRCGTGFMELDFGGPHLRERRIEMALSKMSKDFNAI